MAHEQAMKAALAELEASPKPNYTEIAEKYKLGRHAVSRRHQGKTTSRAVTNSVNSGTRAQRSGAKPVQLVVLNTRI
jgi:hypothetical protein